MSDKTKFPLPQARGVAGALVELLRPSAERIEIVGSIRRRKPYVSDIEILFVPKMSLWKKAGDMFASENISLADKCVEALERDGVLQRRRSIIGRETYGPLNKLMFHYESGIPVDLFSEPEPLDWWRSLVVRTGPKELNVRFATSARGNCLNFHAYGMGLEWNGERIPCASEEEFFKLFNMPYQKPEDR